jgi:hypothetical protein
MKLKNVFILLFVALLCTSCDKVTEKTKAGVNKGGEAVGKTAAEFFEGVAEGVDKTLQCEIVLSQALQSKGVKTGKFSIEKTADGKRNRLALYLIFEKGLEATLTAKVADKNGLEMGRAKLDIQEEAGEAGYYDFEFDSRMQVEAKSKITIE